ncbi:DUF4126 domain-containing protein [Demequina sp. SO4-13]|uniref:DUF4126 domain-containing protein n=1 Tax=Demequina sp. SO4-13 TaxID=3401027 RepID=UPI003AF5355D
MLAALTGAGLSAAAGLNAFIPLVLVGVFARFTEFIQLPAHLEWLQSWPAIIISLGLLVAELIIDKIPGVDHVNDLIQTAVRPVVGGIIFAATAASTVVDESNFWQDNPLIAGVVGAIIALLTHVAKAASRPAVNASTGGTGAPLASFAEDAISVALVLIAIFVPVLVVFVFLFMGIAVYRIVTTGRRRRRHREMRQAEERLERESQEAEGGMVAWWRSKWREPRRLSRSARHAWIEGKDGGPGSDASADSAQTPGSPQSPK